jgi:hypothetical protein
VPSRARSRREVRHLGQNQHALYALFDNCNSLHTNAYDEAITTPTEESVRRAVAIQLIINKELAELRHADHDVPSLQAEFDATGLTGSTHIVLSAAHAGDISGVSAETSI